MHDVLICLCLFRAYRIGQCRDVTVLRLISLGTVEEVIYLRQVYKQVPDNCDHIIIIHKWYKWPTYGVPVIMIHHWLISTVIKLKQWHFSSSNCSPQLWARRVRGGTSRQCRGMVSIRGSCLGSKTSSGCRPKGHASPARYSRLDSLHPFYCLIDDALHCSLLPQSPRPTDSCPQSQYKVSQNFYFIPILWNLLLDGHMD